MKLSESLFDEEAGQDFISAVYNALAEIAFEFDAKRNYLVDEGMFEEAFEWFMTHFFLEDGSFNESLEKEEENADKAKIAEWYNGKQSK